MLLRVITKVISAVRTMEQILIRNLPAGTKAALRARAEQRHRSVEAEARDLLSKAPQSEAVTIVDLLGMHEGAEIGRLVISKERSNAEPGSVLRRWLDEHVLPTFPDRSEVDRVPNDRAGHAVPSSAPSA